MDYSQRQVEQVRRLESNMNVLIGSYYLFPQMSHCFSSNLIFEDVDISFLLPLCYLLFIISSSWVACRPIASLDLANLIPTILILQTYFSYLNMPILSSTHLPTLSSNCSMVLLSTHLILPIPTFDFVAIPHPPIQTSNVHEIIEIHTRVYMQRR